MKSHHEASINMSGESSSSIAEPFVAFNLLGLKDDCILEVFRHLTLVDMATIASTCIRLRDLARQIFVLNKENFRYTIKYHTKVDVKRVNDELISVDGNTRVPYSDGKIIQQFQRLRSQQPYLAELRVQQHLAAFGDLLKELDLAYEFDLTVNGKWLESFSNLLLFNDVIKHCSGTLMQLMIRGIVWTPELSTQARPLLSHLTKFDSSDGQNTELVLPMLQQCVDLRITGECCGPVMHCDFPKLQRFATASKNSWRNQHVEGFLQRHQQLVHLEWVPGFNLFDIGRMHHLEELNISCIKTKFNHNDSSAFRFERLKRLTLNVSEGNVSRLLLHLVDSPIVHTLEYLRVVCKHLNVEAIEALSQFKKLEHFELMDTNTQWNEYYSDIRQLRNMHQLKTLLLDIRCSESYQWSWSTMPSLESLTMIRMRLDSDFIASLADLPPLKHMKLQDVDFGANIDDAQLPPLQNVNCLEKLEISISFGGVFIEKLLKFLGSTETLRSLKLFGSTIDTKVIHGLCRFGNLQHLVISDSYMGRMNENQLCSLQHIKELYLNGVYGSFDEFLVTLGAVDTMEKLHISRSTIGDETIQAICRYRNLRELRLGSWAGLTNAHLMALDGLGQLKQLTLDKQNKKTDNDYDWRGVFELIARSSSITSVMSHMHMAGLSRDLFDGLLQTLCQQNRRVVMEVHEHSDLPRFLFHNNNCQYVEFKQIFPM